MSTIVQAWVQVTLMARQQHLATPSCCGALLVLPFGVLQRQECACVMRNNTNLESSAKLWALQRQECDSIANNFATQNHPDPPPSLSLAQHMLRFWATQQSSTKLTCSIHLAPVSITSAAVPSPIQMNLLLLRLGSVKWAIQALCVRDIIDALFLEHVRTRLLQEKPGLIVPIMM